MLSTRILLPPVLWLRVSWRRNGLYGHCFVRCGTTRSITIVFNWRMSLRAVCSSISLCPMPLLLISTHRIVLPRIDRVPSRYASSALGPSLFHHDIHTSRGWRVHRVGTVRQERPVSSVWRCRESLSMVRQSSPRKGCSATGLLGKKGTCVGIFASAQRILVHEIIRFIPFVRHLWDTPLDEALSVVVVVCHLRRLHGLLCLCLRRAESVLVRVYPSWCIRFVVPGARGVR